MSGPSKTKNVLFVCSQNKLRSPTAEQVFADYPGVETASAGTNHDACNPLDREQVEWADIIFVMEKSHANKVRKNFGRWMNGKRMLCLGIADDFDFMDPELVRLLQAKVPRLL
jgi:predicted protein tyrosine phosphatase